MKTRVFVFIPLFVAVFFLHTVLTLLAQETVETAVLPASPTNSPPQLVERLGGMGRAVAKQGNYAYVGIGNRLEVVNVQNPQNPVRLGVTEELTTPLASLELVGQYGLGPGLYGLQIFDLSDPANPTSQFYSLPSRSVNQVLISGTVAFVAEAVNPGSMSGSGGLRILDVTDPLNPAEVGFYGDGVSVFSVAQKGNYLYLQTCRYTSVGSCTVEFVILNITNLAAPTEAKVSGGVGQTSYDMAVYGDYLYMISSSNIAIVDISNPTSLVGVGGFGFSNSAQLKVIGSRLLVRVGYTVYVYDLATPTSPSLVGSYYPGKIATDFTADSNSLYTAVSGGLHIVDITQASFPLRGTYDQFPAPVDVERSGSATYLLDNIDGLLVLDTSVPDQPGVLTASPPLVGNPFDIIPLDSNDLFVGGEFGFTLLDVTNPISPVHRADYTGSQGRLSHYEVQGNYVFALATQYAAKGLEIVDISNRDNPQLVTTTGSCTVSSGMQMSGSYIFLVGSTCPASDPRVEVIDVSTPASPQLVISTTLSSDAYLFSSNTNTAVLVGDYLYIGGADVKIVDVSDPLNPAQVGTYEMDGVQRNEYKVDARDGNLYVSASIPYPYTSLSPSVPETAYEILDLTDPVNPLKISDRHDYIRSVDLTSGGAVYTYAPLKDSGLSVYKRFTQYTLYLPMVKR